MPIIPPKERIDDEFTLSAIIIGSNVRPDWCFGCISRLHEPGEACVDFGTLSYHEIYQRVMSKYTEHFFRDIVHLTMTGSACRRALTNRYSFAIPSKMALEAIAEHSPIVEMGAGSGYWASELTKIGAKVVAYDYKPPGPNSKNHYGYPIKYFDVKYGCPGKVLDRPDHALFLCWPPFDLKVSEKSLLAYTGNTVIYIGEGGDGCTGTKRFRRLLDERWEKIDEIQIPQWPSLHDYMTIHRRKK